MVGGDRAWRWRQISIFVETAPEKDNIGTILGISFQIGNVSPLILVLLGHWGVKFRSGIAPRPPLWALSLPVAHV